MLIENNCEACPYKSSSYKSKHEILQNTSLKLSIVPEYILLPSNIFDKEFCHKKCIRPKNHN